ncbi:MAG: tetratricopeptide repeat protein [Rugosibacter sp.]|jgi:tetratricopeptide (TPR) repeat protein|nr:tetratricopeptide repeat protein [Rugosibacter sp.]
MNSIDHPMASGRLRHTLRSTLRPVVLALFFCSSFALAKNPSVLLAQGVPTSSVDQASEAATSAKEDERLPKMALTEKILYEFLLAEIAGQRGQMAIASEVYFDLAKNTRDPRIVRRAAEVALYARQYPTALEASRMWVAIDPQAREAQRMLATLLLASGRIDELAISLAHDLENAGPRTGDLLLQQPRVFANYPDKAAVKRLLDQLTQPYAALPEAHLVRAQAALAVNDKAGAMSEVDQALALRTTWEPAALLKAGLLAQGAPQLDFLKRFLAANPSAHDVRLGYARTLVAEKRYDDARKEFETLLRLNPENPDVLFAVGILSLQLNDVATAEKHLKHFMLLGRGEQDAARFYLGQIAEHAGKNDEALEWYRAVADGEQKAPAHVRAAQLLVQQNKLDEAREQIAIARASTPTDSRLIIAESQLLREGGRYTEGYAMLSAALEAQPDDPDLLYETALMAEKLNDVTTMERHLRYLIKLKPEEAIAYNALGYSLADRKVRLAEAMQLIDRALTLKPDDPFILDSKGWALFRQGQANEALTTLKKAYALKPDAEIAAHIGEVLWSLGRHDEAIKLWRDATLAHPKNETLATTIKRFVP